MWITCYSINNDYSITIIWGYTKMTICVSLICGYTGEVQGNVEHEYIQLKLAANERRLERLRYVRALQRQH